MSVELPAGEQPLTLDDLYKATEDICLLPELSERLGKRVTVRHTVISRADWIATLGDPPPGSELWPKAGDPLADGKGKWTQEQANLEYARREQAWMRTLTPDQRNDYNRSWAESACRIAATTALEPMLTLLDARRLGNDLRTLTNSILRLSGIIKDDMPEPDPEEPAAPAAPAPEEGHATDPAPGH